MRCERIKEWMGEHLDGCLDADRTREMNEHLTGCDACRRELEELRQTVALLRDMPAVMPPADLIPSVHRRLSQQPESPMLIFWRVLSLPQTRVAAAAALLIMAGTYGWRTLTAGHGGPESDLVTSRQMALPPQEPTVIQAAKIVRERPAEEMTVRDEKRAKQDVSEITPRPSPILEKPEALRDDLSVIRESSASASAPAEANEPAATSLSLPPLEQKQELVRKESKPLSSPVPADKLAEAETPVRAEEGEARGRIWGEAGGRGGGKLASKPARAIKVGGGMDDDAAPGAVAPVTTKAPLSKNLAATELPSPTVDRITKPSDERLDAGSSDTFFYSADAPAQEAATPARKEREIVLTTRDARAAGKILARYAVHGKDMKKKADEAAKKSRGQDGEESQSGNRISGWVPAARYEQLIAALQSIGTIKPLPATLGWAAGGAGDASDLSGQVGNESHGTELIFVQITLVPPAK
jgi:hypothetical protein